MIERFLLTLIVSFVLLSQSDGQEKRPKRWPFSPVKQISLPKIDGRPDEHPIDALVRSKLLANQLKLAKPATRRQLIRRLYFDLIGLPPTPEEVNSFVQNESPDAYDKLVDRLLKDKRYGERWARLWLDLARYADTAGYEGDPDLPHAWRYRDYVIDAFNNDKPYDLFIKEQIAGDEFEEVMGAGDLPGTPSERIVAMTFLRLAPFTEPRGDESRHELLSEMTSTVGSVFLGLTVGCAKCHDHKHDNIPTKDFYRMKAFFATISIPRPEPGDGFQIGGPIPAPFYRPKEKEWVKAKTAELNEELSSAQKSLSKLKDNLTQRLGNRSGFGIQTLGGELGNDYVFDQKKVNDGKLHWNIINGRGSRWDFYTDGIPAKRTGSLAGQNRGSWFGDLKNIDTISLGQYTEGKKSIADASAHHIGQFGDVLIYDHPLDAKEREQIGLFVEQKYRNGKSASPPDTGLTFWLDASDPDADPKTASPKHGSPVSHWIDKIGGIKLDQADDKLQPKIESLGNSIGVDFNGDFLLGQISKKVLFNNHQKGSIVVIYSAAHQHEGYGFQVGGNGQFLSTFINPVAEQKMDLLAAIENADEKIVSKEEKQEYHYLTTRKIFVPQHLKRLRPVAMSLRHSYGPPYEPGVPTSRIMIRGEYDNPGEVVEPGFLSCITGHQNAAKIRLDPFKRWPTRSRRKALADWIASSANPLTARVMANRLWHWHFGQGIVRTPSDFGSLSGGPSHPELLDWLAGQLIKENWSIKKMHRWIVTSKTYQQTSLKQDTKAENIDPENRLLWKFNRRRLDAEAIRDTVLSVSGRLNPKMYGLPIFPPLPDDIEKRVKYSNSKWDTQHGKNGRRRSLYIYQQRTLTMPLMQSFDALVCEQSRPRRMNSITALQALAMWNGEFVNEEASYFAKRVIKEAGDTPDAQVKRAFELALSRQPTSDESVRMIEFLKRGSEKERSIRSLCRVLLNSNEFIYVD